MRARRSCADDYHEQDDDVDDGHQQADEYGQPPVHGDRVDQREYQRTDVIEHVRGRHERAPELGLAHLADVRRTRATRVTDAQAHQDRARVQRLDVFRVVQHDLRHHVRYVGDDHAPVVPEPAQHHRRHYAPDGREQEQKTT